MLFIYIFVVIQIPARDLQAPHARVVRSAQFGFGNFGNPYGGGGGFGGPNFGSSFSNANAQSSSFGSNGGKIQTPTNCVQIY